MKRENDWTLGVIRKRAHINNKTWNELLDILELELVNRGYLGLVVIQDDGGRRAMFVEPGEDNETV